MKFLSRDAEHDFLADLERAVQKARAQVKAIAEYGTPPATTLTMAEAMVDAGALTEEQAARSGLTNRLYSALGASEMVPSVGLVDFVPGDVLLLCSDGLTKHVSDQRIAEVLGAPGSAESMTNALVAEALAGGGSDNVTVVVARMVG